MYYSRSYYLDTYQSRIKINPHQLRMDDFKFYDIFYDSKKRRSCVCLINIYLILCWLWIFTRLLREKGTYEPLSHDPWQIDE